MGREGEFKIKAQQTWDSGAVEWYTVWGPPSLSVCVSGGQVRFIINKYFSFLTIYKNWKQSKVTQLCPTLCDPMDHSLLGSSVHGILQARILEWAAISFSRGSSRPRDRTWFSLIAGGLFTLWATREKLKYS